MTDPARPAPGELPRIDLYCTTGGSNKHYQLFLERAADGSHTLFYGNGKIGDALKPKVKAGPGTLDAMMVVYNRTVKEKKGASPPYTEAASGVAYSMTDGAGDLSSWTPALLSEVGPEDVGRLIASDDWVLQEKMNGERRGILISADGEVRGANKKGRYVGGLPKPWVELLKSLPPDTVLDGEAVGSRLFVFDVSRIAGVDLRNLAFDERSNRLTQLLEPIVSLPRVMPIAQLGMPVIQMGTFSGAEAKRDWLARSVAIRGGGLVEGAVFRHRQAPYQEGRQSASSAWSLKYKFYEAANCLVLRKNPGSSVALGLYAPDGKLVEVGNVTIQQVMPVPGDVLKVRYMHMFEGGSLYGPPVALGIVAGAAPESCLLSQVTRVMPKASGVSMDDDDYLAEAPEVEADAESNRERMRG